MRVDFKLNLKGLNQLMKSVEMQEALEENAKEMIERAGSGYEKRVHNAKWVSIANVYPNTKEAAKDIPAADAEEPAWH